jgi:fructose-bisphosphate aldolase class I
MNAQKLIDTAQALVAGGQGLAGDGREHRHLQQALRGAGHSRRPRTRGAPIAKLIVCGAGPRWRHQRRDPVRRNDPAENDGRAPRSPGAADAGIVPGIKVDMGAKPLAGHPGQTVTEGLDGLRERFVEYHELGARFAKWRGVTAIGQGSPTIASTPTRRRWRAMPRCAQENGIVPIVEPEVLMDYDNDIDTCAAVTEWVLKEVFQQLYYANVKLEGIVLKPNMIVPGMKAPSRPAWTRSPTAR